MPAKPIETFTPSEKTYRCACESTELWEIGKELCDLLGVEIDEHMSKLVRKFFAARPDFSIFQKIDLEDSPRSKRAEAMKRYRNKKRSQQFTTIDPKVRKEENIRGLFDLPLIDKDNPEHRAAAFDHFKTASNGDAWAEPLFWTKLEEIFAFGSKFDQLDRTPKWWLKVYTLLKNNKELNSDDFNL